MLTELQRLEIERSRARTELLNALSKFNDFVIRGVVPEEFR
jgi:hypothetical protein